MAPRPGIEPGPSGLTVRRTTSCAIGEKEKTSERGLPLARKTNALRQIQLMPRRCRNTKHGSTSNDGDRSAHLGNESMEHEELQDDVGDARQIQTADPVLRRHLLCPLSYRAMVVDAQARFELARWKPRWFCRPVPSATWLLRVMFNGADRRDRTGLLGLEGRCLTTRPDPR